MISLWLRRVDWRKVALAGACLALLVVIGEELTSRGTGMEVSTAVEARTKPPGTEPPLRFAMPPASAFSEILARPLFSRTRRPGMPAGMLTASSSFTLVGIVIAPQDRHALLGFGQPRKLVRVSEGQDVGGWTIEAILPEKVIVRHADVREEISAKDRYRAAGVAGSPAPALVLGGARKPAARRRAHDE